MTRPVLNLTSPIAKVFGGMAYLVPPWNSFFQQFTQQAPAVQDVTQNPFTANQNGTVIVNSAATDTKLTRGNITIDLGAGQKIIPVSIGDTIITDGTSQFLGS